MERVDRIPTGIEGLDPLIGGGFLPGKLYIVLGGAGTGKTVFALQYLNQGLEQGEGGIYVTTMIKPDDLIAYGDSFGWDFTRHVHEKRLAVLEVPTQLTHEDADLKKRIDVRTIMTDLTRHIKRANVRRVVIDPLAPVVLGREFLTSSQRYVRNLIFAAQGNLGCTFLALALKPEGSQGSSSLEIAEYVADGVIELNLTKLNRHYERTLFIRKMRHSVTDLREHTFDILPGRGIVIREPSELEQIGIGEKRHAAGIGSHN